jgi:hypothetical protein
LRGYTVPPYNYAHHRAVTAESLKAGAVAADDSPAEFDANGQAAGSVE